jgi:hypothetical protein
MIQIYRVPNINIPVSDVRTGMMNREWWRYLHYLGQLGVPSVWAPTDASGAALTLSVNAAQFIYFGSYAAVQCNVTFPATSNTSAAVLSGLPISVSLSGEAVAALRTVSNAGLARFSGSSTNVILLKSDGTQYTNAQLSG